MIPSGEGDGGEEGLHVHGAEQHEGDDGEADAAGCRGAEARVEDRCDAGGDAEGTEEEKKKQQEEEEKAWHNSLVWAAIGGIALVGLVLVKKLRHYVCLLTQNGFARDEC